MNRRGFLGAILAAATAPAVVSACNVMRVKPIWHERESGLVLLHQAQRRIDEGIWNDHLLAKKWYPTVIGFDPAYKGDETAIAIMERGRFVTVDTFDKDAVIDMAHYVGIVERFRIIER